MDAEDPPPIERLLRAAHKGTLEDVKKLVAVCPPNTINIKGGPTAATPLIVAASEGRRSVVEFLIAQGANPNMTDAFRRTALHWACWYGHESVVRALLNAGADPTTTAQQGWTGLMEAAERGHGPGIIDMILNNNPATLEQKTSKGRTPLWLAACEGRERVVKVLVRWRADTRVKDADGMDPLGIAREWKHRTCEKLIMDAEKIYELYKIRKMYEDIQHLQNTWKKEAGPHETPDAVKRRKLEAIPKYWDKMRMAKKAFPKVHFNSHEGHGVLEKASVAVYYSAVKMKKELFVDLLRHFHYE